jgi:hypothetical protein
VGGREREAAALADAGDGDPVGVHRRMGAHGVDRPGRVDEQPRVVGGGGSGRPRVR